MLKFGSKLTADFFSLRCIVHSAWYIFHVNNQIMIIKLGLYGDYVVDRKDRLLMSRLH